MADPYNKIQLQTEIEIVSFIYRFFLYRFPIVTVSFEVIVTLKGRV